jgi:FMN-dependent dehydrogenase
VVKALALGATAVGVGRPYAWGLALGGEDGVMHVLRAILAEADLIMAVDGYPTLADLTRDSLRQVRQSSSRTWLEVGVRPLAGIGWPSSSAMGGREGGVVLEADQAAADIEELHTWAAATEDLTTRGR